MPEMHPTAIMLAGPNGAGKTTNSRAILADTLKTMIFVNADVIAQGLAAFNPEAAALEAGRVMLKWIKELTASRTSFAFETTLAARSYARQIKEWQASGYTFQLYYFWLSNEDLAVSRVAFRVERGGHNIPEATIRQRYQRSLNNLFQLYLPLADVWQVYNNSLQGKAQLVAEKTAGNEAQVVDAPIWKLMQERVQP